VHNETKSVRVESGGRDTASSPSQVKPLINPYVVLLIAILGMSFGSVLARLSTAPSLVIATYRNGLAALVLAPVALTMCRKELHNLSPRDMGAALASGFFLSLHFATWITSLEYTSVASSTVLVTLQPIFVILGAYLFLGEKVSPKALLAVLIAIGGSILIGISDFQIGGLALWGDFLALSGGILIAGYVIIGRSLRRRLSLTAYTFIAYGSCSLFLVLMTLFSGAPLAPYAPREWLLFLAMALVPTIMGHSLLNFNLKYLPASTVSMSVLGEPIGASILAALFLKELPTSLQVVGSAIIIVGVYMFMKLSAQSDGKDKPYQPNQPGHPE
jgi:drug/metabolite transporter (DMT)-like permease